MTNNLLRINAKSLANFLCYISGDIDTVLACNED